VPPRSRAAAAAVPQCSVPCRVRNGGAARGGHRTLRTTSRVVLPSTLLRQACTACGGAEVGGHRFGQHTFMGVENHFSSEDDPDAVATDGLTAGCPCTLPGRSRLPAVPERAAVVGLSNSATQRERILEVAAARGFRNVDVVTHINTATLPARHFVRMLSVEMFEHMKSYEALLAKVAASLKDNGLLFVHIFSHKALAYDFNVAEDDSWMARYFLTCGHDALGRPPPALPAARQPRRPLVAQRHALRQNLRGVAGQHGPPRRRGPQARRPTAPTRQPSGSRAGASFTRRRRRVGRVGRTTSSGGTRESARGRAPRASRRWVVYRVHEYML